MRVERRKAEGMITHSHARTLTLTRCALSPPINADYSQIQGIAIRPLSSHVIPVAVPVAGDHTGLGTHIRFIHTLRLLEA